MITSPRAPPILLRLLTLRNEPYTAAHALFGSCALVAALLFGIALTQSLGWPLIHDAAIMHYVAWLISEGRSPYVEIFDMNLPGIYLLHFWIFRLFSDSDLGFRLCDAALLLVMAFCLGKLLWRINRAASVLSASSFPLYLLWLGPNDAFQRDTWVALTMVVGGCYAIRVMSGDPHASRESVESTRRSRSGWWRRFYARPTPLGPAAAAFLLCGYATMIKPTCVFVFLALMAVMALRQPRAIFPATALFAFPIAGLMIWLWSMGSLGEMFSIQAHYIWPLYSRIFPVGVGWAKCFELFTRREPVLGLLALVTVVAFPTCATRARQSRAFRLTLSAACLMAIFGMIHFTIQRRGSLYHFLPLICAVMILATLAMASVVTSSRRVFALLGASLSLILIVPMAYRTGRNLNTDFAASASLGRSRAIEGLIRKHAGDEEAIKVFDTVWGAAKAMLTERKRLTDRFIYDLHFFHDVDQPYIQNLTTEMTQGLLDPKTRTILVTRQGWGKDTHDFDRIYRIRGVRAILDTHYTVVEQTLDARVYKRKSDADRATREK